MSRKAPLKFIWISQFGSLVEIRIREISKRLVEKKISPIVLTYRLQKKEVLNSKSKFQNLKYHHFRNPLFFNFQSKLFKYLREFVFKLAFIFGGMPLLYSDIKTILKKDKDIKFIYASGPLFFTHMLGYLLKKKFKRKLVVEYTDPWYKNPYSVKSKNIFDKIIDYHIERKILGSADMIASNSEYLNELLQQNFPFIQNKPIVAIGDGLNLQNSDGYSKEDEKGITITYGGKIYGRRNIYPLFKIISDLKKEHFFKDFKILIKIYGKYPKKLFETELNKLKIRDFFYLGDYVPRSKFIEEITKSDLALHIGELLDYPTIAFKVWEYLSCKKKILFFNLEDSYRSNFIKEHKLGVVIPIDNLEKGKKIFKELLQKMKSGDFNSRISDDKLRQFSWDKRADKFIACVINNLRT